MTTIKKLIFTLLYITIIKTAESNPATTQPPHLELDITSLFTCPRTCEYFDAFCQRYEKTCADQSRQRECENRRQTMFAHFETFGGFNAVEDRCNCQIECITGPDHTWFYVLGCGFLFLLVSCGIWAWTRGGACDSDHMGDQNGGIPGGGTLNYGGQ